jgi:hypothetical protein
VYTVHGCSDRLHLRTVDLVRDEAAIVADLAAQIHDWRPMPLKTAADRR